MASPTREWLEQIYGNSPGWFTACVKVPGQPGLRTEWFQTSDLDTAARKIEKTAKQYDVWCSVGTYKAKKAKGRGNEDDVLSLIGMWADLDIGEEGHKASADGRPNPSTVEEALSIIEGLPAPTAVIHSGGGLQAWWLFDEPWVFDDQRAAKRACQEWQQMLGAQAKTLGYHVDTLPDVTRILRVPGTFNHKTENVRPVTMHLMGESRYASTELTSLGEAEEETPPPKQFNTWEAILEPHGWKKCGTRSTDGATLWVRPGKDPSEGHSAVTDPYGKPVMVNFSASVGLPTGPGHRLTQFKVWAYLNCGGDLERAKAVLGDLQAVDPDALLERAQRFEPVDWKVAWTQQPEAVEWIVEPLVERGRAVAFYSEAKAGKSLLWREICARLAAGQTCFVEKPKTVDPMNVVYIDLENNLVDIVEDLMAMGFEAEQLVDHWFYYSFPEIGYLDTKAGGLNVLALALRHNADLVIIDTLARVVEGDEQDNNTYAAFYRNTGVLLKSRGIAYVRLDHEGKDLSKGMRGASSKRDDVDEVWRLSTEENTLSLKRTYCRKPHADDNLQLLRRKKPRLFHDADLETIDELMETPEQHELRMVREVLTKMHQLGISRRKSKAEVKKAFKTAGFKSDVWLDKVWSMQRGPNKMSMQEEADRIAGTYTPPGDNQDPGAD